MLGTCAGMMQCLGSLYPPSSPSLLWDHIQDLVQIPARILLDVGDCCTSDHLAFSDKRNKEGSVWWRKKGQLGSRHEQLAWIKKVQHATFLLEEDRGLRVHAEILQHLRKTGVLQLWGGPWNDLSGLISIDFYKVRKKGPLLNWLIGIQMSIKVTYCINILPI